MALGGIAANAQRVPGWFRALVIVPTLGAAAWSCATASGVYAWLAALQMQMIDGYLPVVTGLLTVMVFLLPAAVIVQVAGRFMQRGSAAPSNEEMQAKAQRNEEVAARNIVPIGAILFALVCFGFAGWAGFRGISAGDRLTWELSSDAEWPPPSTWLALRGTPDFAHAISFRDDSGSRLVTHYVPMCDVSSGKGGAPAPCRVVARVLDARMAAFRSSSAPEGMLRGAPSGIIAEGLGDAGANLDPNARVFVVGDNPSEMYVFAQVFGFVGVVSLAIGAAVLLWRRRMKTPSVAHTP